LRVELANQDSLRLRLPEAAVISAYFHGHRNRGCGYIWTGQTVIDALTKGLGHWSDFSHLLIGLTRAKR
jgi:hypothetical protein